MTRYTYIIPAGVVTSVRSRLKDEDAIIGLDGMFTVPMSPNGNLPATHYCSSGILSDEQVAFLEASLPRPFTGGEPDRDPWEVFAEVGLKLVSE